MTDPDRSRDRASGCDGTSFRLLGPRLQTREGPMSKQVIVEQLGRALEVIREHDPARIVGHHELTLSRARHTVRGVWARTKSGAITRSSGVR